MKKGIISILLAMVLCVSFSSCTEKETSQKDNPQSEESQKPVTPSKEEQLNYNGKLIDASMNSITVQGEDLKQYSFSLQDGTKINAEKGMMIGATVTVSFLGTWDDTVSAQVQEVTVSSAAKPESTPASAPLTKQQRAKELMSKMTIEEKVGQMFIVRCPENQAEEMVSKYQMGGYILFARDFQDQTKTSVKNKINAYQGKAKTGMLIGVDEEGGTVNRLSSYKAFRGAPFLSPQALYLQGGFDLIKSDTKEKSDLLKSLGINVNFAPVCDVSVSSKDYMYKRAFGKDAKQTSQYVKTVVSTMKEKQMGSVLKHFPGYGNNVDTHTGISNDGRSYESFQKNDFLPFQAGIKAGADSILVSHNIVASMDAKYPASLSVNVHQILRNELGFDRVIMTDDLYMDAIKKYTDNSSAAVIAVEAGNDLLCCTDFTEQIPSVIKAVKEGKIKESRIEESVLRILQWKLEIGIIK